MNDSATDATLASGKDTLPASGTPPAPQANAAAGASAAPAHAAAPTHRAQPQVGLASWLGGGSIFIVLLAVAAMAITCAVLLDRQVAQHETVVDRKGT